MSEPPVADASPLIILAQAGRFDLLRVAGERILVPRPVEQETLRPGIPDAAVTAIRAAQWVEIVDAGPPPDIVNQQRVDSGEATVSGRCRTQTRSRSSTTGAAAALLLHSACR